MTERLGGGGSEAEKHGTLEGEFLVVESHESEDNHNRVRGLSSSDSDDAALALQKEEVGVRTWDFVRLK